MKAVVTLLLLAAVAGSVALEISAADPTLSLVDPISLGELMARASVTEPGAPSVRELGFKLRDAILAHRELTKAAHNHYALSSCGTPLQRLEEHVSRGVTRRRNSLRYAAVARRRCYQRNNNARELFPKIKKWKSYRRKAIKNLQRAAKRFFREDNRLKDQIKEVDGGLSTVQTLETTLYGAASFLQSGEKLNLVSLIETGMSSTDSLSQQVYNTVATAMKEGAPVDAVYRLVYGVRNRLKSHRATVRAQRERARSSWISLKASLQARVDSLNVRISRARARQASIASFSGRNCRLAARAAYKASKASKALNPARIALENLQMLCTRENHAFNSTMTDTHWELTQLMSVADRLGVPSAEIGEWYASPAWSKCEEGFQTRTVTCRNLGGVQLGIAACVGAAPIDKQPCTKQPSARYREWLLQHGQEFGALSGRASLRHKGYADDVQTQQRAAEQQQSQATGGGGGGADAFGGDEDMGSASSGRQSQARGAGAGEEEARRPTRVSRGSMKELRRRAAIRAAKRARARAARAARRARRNRRRLNRRQRERENKRRDEEKARQEQLAKMARAQIASATTNSTAAANSTSSAAPVGASPAAPGAAAPGAPAPAPGATPSPTPAPAADANAPPAAPAAPPAPSTYYY